MGSKAPKDMERPVDSQQEELSDSQQLNDPGAYFPTHEPGYEKHRNDTVKHAGGQDSSYVPGADTGREGLAETVGSRANAQPGGLGQTNFGAGAPHEQDSSRLGNPPQDYVTPKQHAAQQREHGDTPGTETGIAQGTTGYQGQQSTSRQMPSRSPLLEEPQKDSVLGFGGGQDEGHSLEHQTGAVPNEPASSSSHPKAGSGPNAQSSFSGRSPQEMSQPGNQQGLHTDGRTEGGLAAGALGGAGAVGAAGAAGAGARQAHTSTAGPSGAGPSAPAAPVSDSELVSKYSTKQELSPSKSMLDEEAPAAGDTAGSTGPGPAGTAGMAAASGIAPPGGIGRGQSSDKEPLPTSKNAGLEQRDSMPDLRPQSAFYKLSQEGVLDTDKDAGAASPAKPGTSSSSSKKSKGCCGCSVM